MVKMTAISLVLLVLVIGLFGVIHSMQSKRIIDKASTQLAASVTQGLRRAGEAKFQQLARTTRIVLLQGDYSTLQNLVTDLNKHDELVIEAAVMESSGTLLAHSDLKQVGRRGEEELAKVLSSQRMTVRTDVTIKGQRSIVFAGPVKYRDLRTWFVYMAYSLKPLEAELAKVEQLRRKETRASYLSTILIGLLSMILGVVLSTLQSLSISRPIRALARRADQIAGGDLQARVEVKSNDEIGLLGDRFNYMSHQVLALMEEIKIKAAVEREVEVARALQTTLVPASSIVEIGGMKLAGFFKPAAKCGGDWWSYYEVVDGKLLVLIGDVTGHGLPSAMITAVVKGAASNMISVTGGRFLVHDLLSELHGAVLQTARGRYAMTCFASVYDPRSRQLTYANAGHTFPCLYRRRTGDARWLAVRGSLLGDEVQSDYEIRETEVDPDDMLVWYTDGVVEGQSVAGEQYGYKRLRANIRDHVHLAPDRARDGIIDNIYSFYGDSPQQDDITLVVGKVC
jgi:serine phosphatase RsbU (regulator of sigma subunit)